MNLCSEAGIDASEFQSNDASTDYDHALRKGFQAQGLCRGNDALLIQLDKWEGRRLRTGGDDDVFAPNALCFALFRFHFHRVRILKAAQSVVYRDSVFLHQEIDAADRLLHDFTLAGNHALEIQFQSAGGNAVSFELVRSLVEMFRAVEQCLGRDAPDI